MDARRRSDEFPPSRKGSEHSESGVTGENQSKSQSFASRCRNILATILFLGLRTILFFFFHTRCSLRCYFFFFVPLKKILLRTPNVPCITINQVCIKSTINVEFIGKVVRKLVWFSLVFLFCAIIKYFLWSLSRECAVDVLTQYIYHLLLASNACAFFLCHVTCWINITTTWEIAIIGLCELINLE